MWLIFIELFLNINLYLISLLIFTLYYKHLLLTLISLEFLMINMLLILYNMLMKFYLNLFFMSFFLTISVCESVIGLSLLILMIRYVGNDYMKIMNLMKW